MKNTTSSSFLKNYNSIILLLGGILWGILGLVLEVEVIAARIYFKFIVHRNNSFGVFTIASSIASLERLKRKKIVSLSGVFFLRYWFRPS
jgi:hypothetical protein